MSPLPVSHEIVETIDQRAQARFAAQQGVGSRIQSIACSARELQGRSKRRLYDATRHAVLTVMRDMPPRFVSHRFLHGDFACYALVRGAIHVRWRGGR